MFITDSGSSSGICHICWLLFFPMVCHCQSRSPFINLLNLIVEPWLATYCQSRLPGLPVINHGLPPLLLPLPLLLLTIPYQPWLPATIINEQTWISDPFSRAAQTAIPTNKYHMKHMPAASGTGSSKSPQIALCCRPWFYWIFVSVVATRTPKPLGHWAIGRWNPLTGDAENRGSPRTGPLAGRVGW